MCALDFLGLLYDKYSFGSKYNSSSSVVDGKLISIMFSEQNNQMYKLSEGVGRWG